MAGGGRSSAQTASRASSTTLIVGNDSRNRTLDLLVTAAVRVASTWRSEGNITCNSVQVNFVQLGQLCPTR